ncbi:GntR family transcriptional regulator / MocR family aminotransferase [Streptomyces sp. 2224.1]|uniref:MocR-like pyridoxine biosynthesis transcription factor PdxR n=1 Tax=Streptomyces sp. 2224.1 TaxID=1881020 RepID=UPI00089B7C0B|nr:PLP-dependent aminotransferase family protein [Streptomyces sp. 2224.1]SEB67849.1 GntR family transcriptional regulator / MocR family aminotransferase [Streptomyces sp. 2224.1]
MPESWVNPAESLGVDLHLELTGPGSRRAVLIRALRDAVRSGRLAPGTRLPPYRSLAVDLGIARNTVADAYAELVAEGWLSARQGSGTRVARWHHPDGVPGSAQPPTPHRAPARPSLASRPAHNLLQGQPDAASFPRTAWLAAARRALTAAPHDAFGPGDPRGRPELRRALADYLARARGVRTDPERIVICSGFAHALRLLLPAVLPGPLAVESYSLPFHRHLLTTAGLRTHPLGLDEHGADTAQLARLDGMGAALLTPAHQFPTGVPLHPDRRAAAINWARATGGFILEDDYDGEFRYDRKPVGALQGLDPEHVLHIGSVSKSLSPAVRLGWMVLPDRLVDAVLEAKGEREAWAGVTDQLTLAEFLTHGAYDRHLRRMRQRYRRRRDQLIDTVTTHAPHLTVTGISAGLHAVLQLPADATESDEHAALRAARRQGLALDGLSGYRHPAATMPPRHGLVIGYATPTDSAFPGALEALRRALSQRGPEAVSVGTGEARQDE